MSQTQSRPARLFEPRGRRRQADAEPRHAARGRVTRPRFPASRRSASPRPGATSRPATCTSTSWRARPRRARTRRAARAIMFNTITVSDGISMGTPGMRYSLVSREVIADSIETVVGCRGLRRLRGHRRLRQEHAGLRDGHRAPEPPGGVRLWRHDPARAPGAAATSSRCSRRWARTPAGKIIDARAAGRRAHAIPGPGQLRRHVHGQHHGLGDRGARA